MFFMGEVIELPTQFNMVERFRRGSRVTSQAVDGSVVMTVDGIELWLEFEQAAELLEQLEDAVLEAFTQLRNDMGDDNGRE